jgi:anti-anti-sigma regulatory factor
MATAQGIVRYHRIGTTVSFRVEGRATLTQAAPFRKFAEACLVGGATLFRIDLRDCTYLDSTFLGTILHLHKKGTASGLARVVLVAPSTPCGKILQQMGLIEFLTTEQAGPDEPADWQVLPAEPPDISTFKRTVTQAHEELANLPGPAGEQFRAAVRCLAQAEQQPSSAPARKADGDKP